MRIHELLRRLRPPARLLAVLIALRVNLEDVPNDHEVWTAGAQAAAIAAIFVGVWGATRAVDVLEASAVGRFDIDTRDNLRARSIRTQIHVLTRVLSVVIVIVGVIAGLLTFPWGRQLGTSILAAGGIIGVVAGVAGRSTLGNIVAGLQVAISEPIRLDDVVVVEGEWGHIEEITLTYVVVRVWDQRRLVLPTSYVVEQPFQNWTRSRADIVGAVEPWGDHSAPVDGMRAEMDRLLRSSANWDGRSATLQVTSASEYSMKVRAVVSAADASRAWDLRCEVREGARTMLQVTEQAAMTLDAAKRQQQIPENFGIRVFGVPSEEGELDIRIGFAEAPSEDDAVDEQHGTRLFVAKNVAEPLAHADLDVTAPVGQRRCRSAPAGAPLAAAPRRSLTAGRLEP